MNPTNTRNGNFQKTGAEFDNNPPTIERLFFVWKNSCIKYDQILLNPKTCTKYTKLIKCFEAIAKNPDKLNHIPGIPTCATP